MRPLRVRWKKFSVATTYALLLGAAASQAHAFDMMAGDGAKVDLPTIWAAQRDQQRQQQAADAPVAKPDLWSDPNRKSYSIPALDVAGFAFLLNQFDRHVISKEEYGTDLHSIKRNIRGPWVIDNDPFKVNQLGHPYQGSMFQGFARSAGLSYWESLAYSLGGSALWEIAGETTPPSKNDLLTTGIGGSFLGEALFRMSNLLLEKGGGMSPFWRELGAAAISPSTAFNRYAYGKRFDAVFPSNNPAYYSRLSVGASATTNNTPGTSSEVDRNEGIVEFSLDYGLPGKPGYQYRRPFDYFSFQATASTANGFESLLTRGLLFGTDYSAGQNYKGVWGLYGSYDYITPQVFRISSTALSLGTTGEWRPLHGFALQGTGMFGFGYAGVGTLHGQGERDYHFGVAPQALLALRTIFGDQASIDLTAREYFVSGVASDSAGRGGHDNIARADAAFTWRIHKQHAVMVRAQWNRRDATYPGLGDRPQTRSTIGVFYTLLGHDRFGSFDWKQ